MTNLIVLQMSSIDHTTFFCYFMSREASKSDSVSRPIFVNVRHFEVMNLIIKLLTKVD